jgi:hypothetical protein
MKSVQVFGFIIECRKEILMQKMLNVALTIIAIALILASAKQGMDFGLTAEGPPIQGYVGGLFPTVASLIGAFLLVHIYSDQD